MKKNYSKASDAENLIIAASKEEFSKKDISETKLFEDEITREEIEFDKEEYFDNIPLEDNMKLYLNDINKQEKLSHERELALLKQKENAQKLLIKKGLNISLPIKAGDWHKIKAEKDIRIIKQGELAVNRLVECNLRLVISVAKHYKDNGIGILDLIQEGNIGLIKGVEKFDTKKGCKLSTYITWWIRHYIAKYITDHSRNIRIPSNVIQLILKINKIKGQYYSEHNKDISTQELAKKMKLPKQRIEDLLLINLNTISIDTPVGSDEDENETTIGDLVADTSNLSQEELMNLSFLREALEEIMSQLTFKEQQVIRLRYGFDDYERTVEETSKVLKIPKRRVIQLEDKALRKLKNFAEDKGISPEVFGQK